MLVIERLTPEQREWIESRPPAVRALIEQFPPGRYRIRPGAPYGTTAPGCVVAIRSYFEDGRVSAVVLEATASAEHHTANLRRRYGRGPDTAVGISASVDPQWLELVEVYPEIAPAWDSPAEEPRP